MKILHCSDLHYSKDAINWIDQNRNQYDVVCISGDFLDDRYIAETSLDKQVEFFKQWFSDFKQPLLVCSGNHDYFKGSLTWLSQNNKLNGDGTKLKINGTKFGCIGYDANDFENYADCEVILYHVPPSNSSCAIQNNENFGCFAIKSALKQTLKNAKFLLCGHVHRPKKHAIRLGNVIVSNAGGIHKNNQASYAVIEVN